MTVILVVIIAILGIKLYNVTKPDGSPPPLGSGSPTPSYTPTAIGREAEQMRNSAESDLRASAEALLPRYDQSAIVSKVMEVIRDTATGAGEVLWDLEIASEEIIITVMTASMGNQVALVQIYEDYQELGFRDPNPDNSHRLAFALALQKHLGDEYGIDYEFRYFPETNTGTMRRLTVSYRRKERRGEGTPLHDPLG